MREPDGQAVVILRRLDALGDAIRVGDMKNLQFLYDNARSAVEKRLGTRDRPYDNLAPDPADSWTGPVSPGADWFREAAAESDTLGFTITNMHPEDKELTLSAEALDGTGHQILAWIAARIIHRWRTTGVAPKFAKIDVKVGLE